MSGAREFDLVVLGAGSGGLAAAFRAAAHGARVALLEPGELGGTCVNAGCVPKKAMWFAADLADKLDCARELGFDVPELALPVWTTLLARRNRYIANLHRNYRQRLDDTGVTVLPHRGCLVEAPDEVICNGAILRAPHLLVATGGRPRRGSMPGAELGRVSDDVFTLQAAPEKVAVIGGGYVAVEMASMLQALGSRVSLFVRESRLLQRFDADITTKLAEAMVRAGIELHLQASVDALEGEVDRTTVVSGGTRHGDFDFTLLATGRSPNTDGLGVDSAGLRLDERGHIWVDAWQNSSRPGTYAVGDVTDAPALTPYAIAAARSLMDRLFGGNPQARLHLEQVPTAVFTHPPLAMLGLTEVQARQQHGDAVRIHRAEFRPMLYGLADGDSRSLFKLVCVGQEQRVVGLHLLGESSDEILQGFAVAVKLGATLADLQGTLAIHPTSAEEVVLIGA